MNGSIQFLYCGRLIHCCNLAFNGLLVGKRTVCSEFPYCIRVLNRLGILVNQILDDLQFSLSNFGFDVVETISRQLLNHCVALGFKRLDFASKSDVCLFVRSIRLLGFGCFGCDSCQFLGYGIDAERQLIVVEQDTTLSIIAVNIGLDTFYRCADSSHGRLELCLYIGVHTVERLCFSFPIRFNFTGLSHKFRISSIGQIGIVVSCKFGTHVGNSVLIYEIFRLFGFFIIKFTDFTLRVNSLFELHHKVIYLSDVSVDFFLFRFANHSSGGFVLLSSQDIKFLKDS